MTINEHDQMPMSLDQGPRGPLYRRVAARLRSSITSGEIAAGTRLPTERSLADELGVSRTTVVAAYASLESDGLIVRRQGSGTFVSAIGAYVHSSARDTPSAAGRAGNKPERPAVINLSRGFPAPLPAVADTLARVAPLLTEVIDLVPYSARGTDELRQAVADYLSARGLRTHAEQVVITAGAHQGLDLVARSVLRANDTALVENPTYCGANDILRTLGVKVVPVAVTGSTAMVDRVESAVRRAQPGLVYLTSSHQNPTGHTIDEQGRDRLARLSESSWVPFIDDDTLADLDVGTPPPPPIAAFATDSNAPIFTVGSLSKLIWAGLRVGWVRAPSKRQALELAALKATIDMGTSLLSQAVATELLAGIDAARQVRRAELTDKLAVMQQRLRAEVPDWTWDSPNGGLSLWLTLPSGNADEFIEVALRYGVQILPGSEFAVDHKGSSHVRMTFEAPIPDIVEGVRRMAMAWNDYCARGPVPAHSKVVL